MRNFSLKTRENFHRNSKRQTLVRVGVSVAIAFFALYLAGGLLGKVVSIVTAPVYSFRHWMAESSATVPLYFRSRTELLGEIAALKDQLAALSGSDAAIERMRIENDELRSLLSIYDEERVAAAVVARPPYVPYDALLIDRGSNDGIREGAIVYYAHDRAIGVVARTFAQSALVTLFSSPGIMSTVYLIGPNVFTTAYGEGGGVMRVTVPQGIPLMEGDVAVVPSLAVGILGAVSAVASVSTEPEQNGFITFEVPLQSIRAVSVSPRTIEHVDFDTAQEYMKALDYTALGIEVPEAYRVPVTATSTPTTTTDVPGPTSP